MFDIGFSEIVVIGVVALVVIGPERLPKTARMLGHLFGRLQRYVNEVKSDISREMELDELRKLKSEVQGAARDFQQSVTSATSSVESGLRGVERELNDAGSPAAAAAAPLAEPATPTAPASSSTSATTPAAAPAPTADPPRQPSLPGFDPP